MYKHIRFIPCIIYQIYTYSHHILLHTWHPSTPLFQLGVYRKSKLKSLKDTSDLAPQAVQDLTTTEGSTLKSFRYQVRLGVGKHFSQWIYFMLPFYVDLKIWWALLSIVVGWAFGYLVLFVVFKCRQRYKKHKERVAICAGIFLSVISALCFTRGMYIVQEGWVSLIFASLNGLVLDLAHCSFIFYVSPFNLATAKESS